MRKVTKLRAQLSSCVHHASKAALYAFCINGIEILYARLCDAYSFLFFSAVIRKLKPIKTASIIKPITVCINCGLLKVVG